MIEIIAPVLPESVAEGTPTTWCKQEGEYAKRDDVIAELETDKIILKIPAPHDDVLSSIIASKGSTVTSTQLLARLKPQAVIKETITPVTETLAMPSVRLEVQHSGAELADVVGSGRNGRILEEDVQRVTSTSVIQSGRAMEIAPAKPSTPGARQERREPTSHLRQRIAECLLAPQQNNVILTTFNEVNMQSATDLRTRRKDYFTEKHGVKLGLMSFFAKAVIRALEHFPVVDANADGNEIIWRDYCDIDIAVSSNRGPIVPALRNAQSPSLVETERQIAEYATQVRNGKLPLGALQGDAFSITNGGTFGSMMSTPVINPSQPAVLGVHVITPRLVVESDQAVIRPMMYLAFSYDHRITDGQETVQALVAIREPLESPEQLLLDL